MIKLISLQGFLNLSADAESKIKGKLRRFGLTESDVSRFDFAEDFVQAISIAVDERQTVIAAAEKEEYNSAKRMIMTAFGLDGKSSPEIAETISREREERIYGKAPDMEGHCFIPSDAEIYLTKDGLYCGFCVEFATGAKIIYLPLDSARLDQLIGFVEEELGGEPEKDSKEAEAESTKPASKPFSIFDDDDDGEEKEAVEINLRQVEIPSDKKIDLSAYEEAKKAAEKAVYSLIQRDKTVVFIESEESETIRAIGESLNSFDEAAKFVPVKIENEAGLEPQVVLARKTRLALRDTDASFAAAVSDIIEGERDGEPFWYAYIVIHDGTSAKAKKVSASAQGKDNLLPHAFAVMFDVIAEKAGVVPLEAAIEAQEESADKKKKRLVMAACIIIAAVAIISAIIMVIHYFGSYENPYNTTSSDNPQLSQSGPGITITTDAQTQAPATDVSEGEPLDVLTTDPSYSYPAEDTAGNISVSPTSPLVPSQAGTFTFTVYGYGHGVGMSQKGAEYYASFCGWNYIEILSLYYYGTVLVMGDSYPDSITYGGQAYSTRDYLATAVESEMGASYNPEALKAQTVAIYSFAKYCNYNVASTAHAFGKAPSEAVYAAVDAVIGQYLMYNGKVCQTFFHAMSAGKTTSYSNTFGGNQVAYLSGGRPSYGDAKESDFVSTVTFSSDEIKAKVYSTTGIELSGDPATWFTVLSHDGCINANTGYVASIQVGDRIFTGNKFRLEVLGGALRSHCFSMSYTPQTTVS